MSRKKCQNDNKTFGGRLRSFREFKGLGVKLFSKLIGISHASLSQTENNKTITSAQTISNLVQNTNINIYWLCTGEGDMIRGDDKEKYVDEKGSLYNKVEMPVMHVAAPGAEYNADMDDFGRAATGLKEIFDSGDPVLIPAIQANIHAFQISARREAHIQEQTKEMNDLKKRIESLEKQMKEGERRKGERRLQDFDPPNGEDRRSGEERRAM